MPAPGRRFDPTASGNAATVQPEASGKCPGLGSPVPLVNSVAPDPTVRFRFADPTDFLALIGTRAGVRGSSRPRPDP